jgi:signal transduction histidine kinase
VQELLREADAELMTGLDELRALARGIHPAVLTDEGLHAALASLARRATVPVEIRAMPEERLGARRSRRRRTSSRPRRWPTSPSTRTPRA